MEPVLEKHTALREATTTALLNDQKVNQTNSSLTLKNYVGNNLEKPFQRLAFVPATCRPKHLRQLFLTVSSRTVLHRSSRYPFPKHQMRQSRL